MRVRAGLILSLVSVLCLCASSAHAYLYGAQSPAIQFRYRFTPAFTTMWGTNGQARVNNGAASWATQDLAATGRTWLVTTAAAENNVVLPANLPTGTRGEASLPCLGNGQNCYLRLNDNPTEVTFHLGTGAPPAGTVDMWSVAAHEFGHWAGLGDLSAMMMTDDRPASGLNAPATMLQGVGGTGRRTIEQDDINGFHHTLPGQGNILANRGYEFVTPLSWRHLAGPGGGSSTRYCDPPNAFAGSCFIQFNGSGVGGASMFQDLIPRGPGAANLINPSIRVRNDGGATVPVTLAVFWNSGANSSNVNCNLAPGVWTLVGGSGGCPLTAVNTGNSNTIRFQLYNYGGGNVSIDASSMGAD